ncbi:MAG: aminotransferase class I/II-fold pyridoxal phosphate-dependent enzyme [Veillonella sp.]|nr:aminotransferase class I/II-fold pyridoxal phosphate-dependent enzyme [Veillonella sp.]
MTSVAAKHAKGKKLKDVIFVTAGQAQADAKENGRENVVNGTLGAIYDEDGKLVFLKTVKDEYLSLPDSEYVGYAPIAGVPEFLAAAEAECFGQSRPEGHIRSIATTGGTGGIVLTADWYWGAYRILCSDVGRTLVTYSLFDEHNNFNHEAFQNRVNELAAKQTNVVILFNTPGNNPTGYSIEDKDWESILNFLKELVAIGRNNVIIGIDVAYLDYSGEKEEVRAFFSKFSHLPKEILTCVCYSLSKGFTMYGQSRATWSNICRPAMRTMANIVADPAKFKAYEDERNCYYQLIRDRADIFKQEAARVGLPMLPYRGGFFITIPTDSANAICEELKKEHIYVIALTNGIRIAACGIPKFQMTGLAEKIYNAMKRLGKL